MPSVRQTIAGSSGQNDDDDEDDDEFDLLIFMFSLFVNELDVRLNDEDVGRVCCGGCGGGGVGVEATGGDGVPMLTLACGNRDLSVLARFFGSSRDDEEEDEDDDDDGGGVGRFV